MTDQTTQPAPTTGGMPSTLQLVREVVETFQTDKSKSSLASIDSRILVQLGQVLVNKDLPWLDGLKLLDEKLGEGKITKSAYFRFKDEFIERYSAVRRRYRERLAKLSIEHATSGQTDQMAAVLINQVMRLSAEKVVDTDDLAQLEGKELGTIVSLIDGWSRSKFKRAELDLKEADAERKAEKLEADLAKAQEELRKLKQDNDDREEQRRRAADKAKTDIERITKDNAQVSREDVVRMIDAVMKGEA